MEIPMETGRGREVHEVVLEVDVGVEVAAEEEILVAMPVLLQYPATIDSIAGRTTENFLQGIGSTFAL